MGLLEGLLTITVIQLLAAASPGPDFLLVSQKALTQGKRAGLFCSLGIAAGQAFHLSYSILGLAVLIANSSQWLLFIKIAGGSYLIYLGIKGIRSSPKPTPTNSYKQNARITTAGESFKQGLLCNCLNPKAPIYFVALFTTVLSPGLPLFHLAIYSVWIMVIQLSWFSALTFFISRPVISEQFNRIGHWLDRVFGCLMIAIGFKVLTSKIE